MADPIERCSDVSMEDFKRYSLRRFLLIFLRAFDVNMFSAVCKLAIPHLRKSQGRIVFTSTGVAESPMVAWSSYCR